MKRQAAGFTLIELVMVIVILGILAAFALPRFANLSVEARAASVNGAAGAIKAASSIAHSKWLAGGGSGNSPTTVSLEGTSITMLNGYPDTVAAGIQVAAQIDTSYTIAGNGASGGTETVDLTTTTPASCRVSYTAAGAGGAPTITVVTSDCS